MMSPREINNLVEGYIGTNAGYLNDFSYSIHDAFYQIYCGLDINVAAYRAKGLTTRRAFIEILKEAKPRDQAKIIRGVFEMIPPPEEATDDAARKRLALHKELLDVAARLEPDGQVETPEIAATSEVVLEALRDAEVLLKTRGPKSAVDRVHTALHGYLKKLCSDRGAKLSTDPSLTTVFKVIREQFPEFSATIPHDTIRNRGTLAHPNELLLEAPEAMLYINLSRAVLGFIEAKIKT